MEPETDLVVLAEREVIEAAKYWAIEMRVTGEGSMTSDSLLKAVVLLEEREKQKAEIEKR